jgi:stage V sporulation protein B
MSTPPAPESPAPATASAPASSTGTGAGRGVLLIAFAKLYFMVTGLVVQVRLPTILSRVAFGAYGFVSSVVSPINNVMVTGSIQAVSRFTAQTPEHARLVQAAGLRMHLFIGLPVAILFIAAAPLVAWLMEDSSKTLPLMLSGAIVAGYSFYAVLVGTANGTRQFQKQAGLDITFATLRVGAMIGMAMLGLGVVGVFAGWIGAVGLILLISAAWIGLPKRAPGTERMPVGPMVRFFAGVATYLLLFNVLMFVDTWLLKRLTNDYFQAHAGQGKAALDGAVPWLRDVLAYDPAPAQLADVQVAYYTAVQTLARLSYQAIIAATFVIFPLVSRSTFEGDRATTRAYVHVTMRYSLMFAGAIAVVMAANPLPLLDVVYELDYATLGAPALAALALGNVAFSLFAIAGTILNGAGFSRDAIISAAVTLAIAVVGNLVVIPQCEPGQQVLLGAATVTGGAMLIGAALSGYLLHRRLGAFLPLLSVVRVGLATAVAIAVGYVLPMRSPMLALAEAVIVGLVFLVVLVGTRELGKRDLAAIVAVRKKRGTEDV